jgi:hypothetical protein
MLFEFHDPETAEALLSINHRLEKIMSALDNLTAAEAKIETVMTAVLADIDTLSAELAAANTSNDPAIQAVADKLTTLSTTAQAKLPPAPAVPAQ